MKRNSPRDRKQGSAGASFLTLVIVLFGLIPSSNGQQKLDQLLVHGDGFLFSLKEPEGWSGDTENAEKFSANVVLHENGKPKNDYAGLIRISLNEKTDENIAEDMAADMREYSGRYPKVQFKDLAINHPGYKSLAKVFYESGEFYEYVAYVNPGPKSKFLFSISMNTGKTEASEKELAAFKSALQSLTLLKR
ncbi:MAG TPA: hypothetical protein VN025_03405 [Candidatus Dormibacteraeota bacterium]|nr:hypothetical protein [Candidatus Dormibacteraeota bacterium]